jgi:RNA polymerase sigma-70 factor (ECF subfamily)
LVTSGGDRRLIETQPVVRFEVKEETVTDQDRAAVAAVKSGDSNAFRGLVDRHKDRLYGVLLSLVGDADLAEELAQETFVKAYASISGFREDSSFGTWLIQIAIHGARDHRRKMSRLRKRRVVSLEALREAKRYELEPADSRRYADPSSDVESQEEIAVVREALTKLPPEYREVLVLKHFEDWPYERIAEATGDTVGTLKVRAHRARQMLKESLAELGWGAGPIDTDEQAWRKPPGRR